MLYKVKNNLATVALLLTAAWFLMLIVFFVSVSSVADTTIEANTWFAKVWLIRLARSVVANEASFFDLLSVNQWTIYLTLFLSSLGALGGLFKLVDGVANFSTSEFSSERRRNILILNSALFFTTVLGSITVLGSSRKKYVLRRLYVLEVHLVRFEGLLFNAISLSVNDELFQVFLEYMLGYYARIEGLVAEIQWVHEFPEGRDIEPYMVDAVDEVEYIILNGFGERDGSELPEGQHPSPLFSLLSNFEAMREVVRSNIRALEA